MTFILHERRRTPTPSIDYYHRCWRIVAAALLLFALLVVVLLFSLKRWYPSVLSNDGLSGFEAIQHEEDNGLLQDNQDQLRQQVVELRRRSQVDKETLRLAKEQLQGLQDERLRLEEEVARLHGLVVPGDSKEQLRIQHFRLEKMNREGRFRYIFTVSKITKDAGYAAGRIWMTLYGKQGENQRTLPLKMVTTEKIESLKMRFRQFQKVEGALQLPYGFKPLGVTIEVRPDNGNITPVKSNFDWVVAG